MAKEKEHFEVMLAGIKRNKYLSKEEQTDWVKYLECSMKHIKWEQPVLKFFLTENENVTENIRFRDLWSIIDSNGWLEDVILDSVLYHYFDKKKIGYINTSLVQAIESSFLSEDTPTPFKNDKDGYVALKNINKDHWIFVYISFKDKTFYVVDSLYRNLVQEAKQIVQSFQKVHHNELNTNKKSKWNFIDHSWKIANIDHTPQKDNSNCGIICIQYAVKVLDCHPNVPARLTFDKDMDSMRQYLTALLLYHCREMNLKVTKGDGNLRKHVLDRSKVGKSLNSNDNTSIGTKRKRIPRIKLSL